MGEIRETVRLRAAGFNLLLLRLTILSLLSIL